MRLYMATGIMAALIVTAALVPLSAGEKYGDAERLTSSLHWHAEVAYPDLGLPTIDARIRDWLENAIHSAMEDAGHIVLDKDRDAAQWDMWIDYHVSRPSPAAVSVIFDCYTFPQGAAHPSGSLHSLNFMADSGKQVEPADMFANPDKALEIFAAQAKALVMEELRANNPEEFGANDAFADLVWFDEGFARDWQNYGCIEMIPDGVRLHFQQYQVLPYVFGMPTAEFSLDMLAPAGPNQAIWPESGRR